MLTPPSFFLLAASYHILSDKFIYINQIICSVSHIEKIEGNTVFLSDGSRINAAKGSVRKIKNTLLHFWTDASLLIFVFLFAKQFYQLFKNSSNLSTANSSCATLTAGLLSSFYLDIILLICFFICFLISLFVLIRLRRIQSHAKK